MQRAWCYVRPQARVWGVKRPSVAKVVMRKRPLATNWAGVANTRSNNMACDHVCVELEKEGWEVSCEKSIDIGGGSKQKPDLIARKVVDGIKRCFILDVTIVFKDKTGAEGMLEDPARKKVKYGLVREHAARLYGATLTHTHAWGLIFGVRGATLGSTRKLLRNTKNGPGLTRKPFIRELSGMIQRASLNQYDTFTGRCTWNLPGPVQVPRPSTYGGPPVHRLWQLSIEHRVYR